MKEVRTLSAASVEDLDSQLNKYNIDSIKFIGGVVVHTPSHVGARTTFYQQILIFD